MTTPRWKFLASVGGGVVLAVGLTACSGGSSDQASLCDLRSEVTAALSDVSVTEGSPELAVVADQLRSISDTDIIERDLALVADVFEFAATLPTSDLDDPDARSTLDAELEKLEARATDLLVASERLQIALAACERADS